MWRLGTEIARRESERGRSWEEERERDKTQEVLSRLAFRQVGSGRGGGAVGEERSGRGLRGRCRQVGSSSCGVRQEVGVLVCGVVDLSGRVRSGASELRKVEKRKWSGSDSKHFFVLRTLSGVPQGMIFFLASRESATNSTRNGTLVYLWLVHSPSG